MLPVDGQGGNPRFSGVPDLTKYNIGDTGCYDRPDIPDLSPFSGSRFI